MDDILFKFKFRFRYRNINIAAQLVRKWSHDGTRDRVILY